MTVEKFVVDMHEAFISTIEKNALMRWSLYWSLSFGAKVNEAFDKVRKFEFKKQKSVKMNSLKIC